MLASYVQPDAFVVVVSSTVNLYVPAFVNVTSPNVTASVFPAFIEALVVFSAPPSAMLAPSGLSAFGVRVNVKASVASQPVTFFSALSAVSPVSVTAAAL